MKKWIFGDIFSESMFGQKVTENTQFLTKHLLTKKAHQKIICCSTFNKKGILESFKKKILIWTAGLRSSVIGLSKVQKRMNNAVFYFEKLLTIFSISK
jgi:hypothetical protein